MVYLASPRSSEKESPVLAGFSVPKKKFRSSVDRHRIRRLMVESWRLNKQLVYIAIPEKIQLHIFFIFTDNKMPGHHVVSNSMMTVIDKIKVIVPSLLTAGGEKIE